MTIVALTAAELALLYDVSVETMNAMLAHAERHGLLEPDEHGRWHATDRGRRRSDPLLTLDDELTENAA